MTKNVTYCYREIVIFAMNRDTLKSFEKNQQQPMSRLPDKTKRDFVYLKVTETVISLLKTRNNANSKKKVTNRDFFCVREECPLNAL